MLQFGMYMRDGLTIEKRILEFNNDPDVFALRNRYSQKSFWDIMSTSRSENRHSAFLAWLLEGGDFALPHQDHPIVHLLDSVMMRIGDKNGKILNDDKFKKLILTRDIKSIEIKEVKTEKSLGALCKDVDGRPLQEFSKLDRIDVYIRFSIIRKTKEESLDYELIIENKIGSSERDSQTVKYYNACTNDKRYEKPKNGSIFIYLTPEDAKSPESPYFIHITYQNVLDNIIEPLLLPEVNISDRVRLFLAEYISTLSLPAYEQSDDSEDNAKQIKDAIILAVRSKERHQLSVLWNKHKDLLTSAIESYNQIDGDWQRDINNQTLKQFCEVNKELIIAILRVAVESNPDNKEELKCAYRDLIRQKRDYSTFKINRMGKEYTKGLFFLEIVKRWADSYNKNECNINPIEKINELQLTGKNDDTIISDEQYKSKKTKKQDAKTNPQDRYYKDFITVGGNNYYVTTQWGQGGDRFKKWLEYIGITFERFNNTANGESDEVVICDSKSVGEKILRSLGIESIMWTRILK